MGVSWLRSVGVVRRALDAAVAWPWANGRRGGRGLATAIGAAALGLVSASPAATTIHRYSGTCQITGAATGYDPPLSFHPAARAFRFTGAGECTGSTDGRKLTRTLRVRTSIRGRTTVDSCKGFGITEHAAGILQGVGSAEAQAIRVSFLTDVFIDGVTVTTATLGDHGGAALGSGMIHPDQTTLKDCARGTLETLRFTLTMHTVTPFVLDAPRATVT